MRSIDPFLGKMPRKDYNCLDFVREVWMYLCDEDITDKLRKLQGAFSGRRVTLSGIKAFKELINPLSPCFVVMQRSRLVPHVGIYLDGRVLHLHDRGVEFQPLYIAQRYFKVIRYYR